MAASPRRIPAEGKVGVQVQKTSMPVRLVDGGDVVQCSLSADIGAMGETDMRCTQRSANVYQSPRYRYNAGDDVFVLMHGAPPIVVAVCRTRDVVDTCGTIDRITSLANTALGLVRTYMRAHTRAPHAGDYHA
jgi:hypothetical protein